MELWTSDTAAVNLGFRLPAKYTYGFVSVGFHPFAYSSNGESGFQYEGEANGRGQGWEMGLGYGGHIPFGRLVFLDLDVAGYAVASGMDGRYGWSALARARLLVGVQIARHFAIFGGPTVGVHFDDPDDPVARPGYGWTTGGYVDENVRIRAWPGFAAGLRF